MFFVVVFCKYIIGALLYEMLSGLPPFYSRSREVMFEKIMKAELNFPPFLSDVSFYLVISILYIYFILKSFNLYFL